MSNKIGSVSKIYIVKKHPIWMLFLTLNTVSYLEVRLKPYLL